MGGLRAGSGGIRYSGLRVSGSVAVDAEMVRLGWQGDRAHPYACSVAKYSTFKSVMLPAHVLGDWAARPLSKWRLKGLRQNDI